jgi:peptidoglycan/LPS O-acetylase OafA/YrhL
MSRKYFASLDGLRGLAILMVFCYHYFPHRGTGVFGYLCSGMWTGVDLFFVLSGFLITVILFDTQKTAGFYKYFYVRRALRLFPVYLLFVFVILLIAHGPYGHSWALLGTPGHSWAVTLSYLLYGSNIIRFFNPGFVTVGPVSTGHLWSLAVEEQFYLVWPFLLSLLSTRKRILAASIVGSIGALALRLVLAHTYNGDQRFIYLELPTRADSLLLGSILAMLYRDQSFMAKLRRGYGLHSIRIIGLVATTAFCAMAIHIHSFYFAAQPIDTWGLSLTAIASGALLLLSLQDGTWTRRILSTPLLRFYGRYSYGLYLIHFAFDHVFNTRVIPAMAKVIHPLQLAQIVAFTCLPGTCTGVAVLSFHFIEKPFLELKRHFEYRRAPLVEKAT